MDRFGPLCGLYHYNITTAFLTPLDFCTNFESFFGNNDEEPPFGRGKDKNGRTVFGTPVVGAMDQSTRTRPFSRTVTDMPSFM